MASAERIWRSSSGNVLVKPITSCAQSPLPIDIGKTTQLAISVPPACKSARQPISASSAALHDRACSERRNERGRGGSAVVQYWEVGGEQVAPLFDSAARSTMPAVRLTR